MSARADYGRAFVNNFSTVFLYKSARKNAKITKQVHVCHLTTNNDDGKISSERMKACFINLLKYVTYYSDSAIDLSVHCVEWKNAIINGERKTQNWYWETGRIHFDSFTEAAHWLYFNLFCRIYPYCEIDFTEIEMDPSYKYFLNEFNKMKEGNHE